MHQLRFCLLSAFTLLSSLSFYAQMITGVWKGKVGKQKAEIKIVQQGDSLRGTSYYYESANNYRRYSIKGYFDPQTNAVVWWDDQLIEEKSGKLSLSSPGKLPLLARADFNCPGGGIMMLDGNAALKDDDTKIKGPVDLSKAAGPSFEDEWDFIIDNFMVGANDPELIDSIAAIGTAPAPVALTQEPVPAKPVIQPVPPRPAPPAEPVVTQKEEKAPPKKETVFIPAPPPPKAEVKKMPELLPPPAPPTIEEKYSSRKKVILKEIPLEGETVEIRFYDNAEIDGDSISLFLNDKLIHQHVRLLGSAFIVKLNIADLSDSNELTMVAENLGSIPPNTAYMVAIVNGNRYETRMESNEGSSATIRFFKNKTP